MRKKIVPYILGGSLYAFLFTEFFKNSTLVNFDESEKKTFQPLRVRANDHFF